MITSYCAYMISTLYLLNLLMNLEGTHRKIDKGDECDNTAYSIVLYESSHSFIRHNSYSLIDENICLPKT
jgi:hypothetical protein